MKLWPKSKARREAEFAAEQAKQEAIAAQEAADKARVAAAMEAASKQMERRSLRLSRIPADLAGYHVAQCTCGYDPRPSSLGYAVSSMWPHAETCELSNGIYIAIIEDVAVPEEVCA